MRASIGFQSGYAPNTASAWRYSSSLLWPPFPAREHCPCSVAPLAARGVLLIYICVSRRRTGLPLVCASFSVQAHIPPLAGAAKDTAWVWVHRRSFERMCVQLVWKLGQFRQSEWYMRWFFLYSAWVGQPFLHRDLKRPAMKLLLNTGHLGDLVLMYLQDALKRASCRQWLTAGSRNSWLSN